MAVVIPSSQINLSGFRESNPFFLRDVAGDFQLGRPQYIFKAQR
jgi:hypothetical protein